MINALEVSGLRALPRHNTNLLTRANPEEQIMLMCASALFTGLSSQECSEILPRAKTRTFFRNDVLFFQGQPVDKVFLIQAGSVKLTQMCSDESEVILWMSGAGDAVGVHAETIGCNHTCSARVMERCQALVWEPRTLHALIARYPQIHMNIAKILTNRLRELEERFREVASEEVSNRLALLLLRLAKSFGRNSPAGVQLELKLRREELAQMAGTTLFTISRIFSKWALSGLVAPRREGVLIPDPDRLKACADPRPLGVPRRRGKTEKTRQHGSSTVISIQRGQKPGVLPAGASGLKSIASANATLSSPKVDPDDGTNDSA